MASNNSSCPFVSSCDWVGCKLSRVGVNRSALVTLALVPFAWDGVVWFRDAVVWAWQTLAGAFSAVS